MLSKTYTDEELIGAVKNSISILAVIKKLGLHACGGNYSTIHRHISRLNLDTSHFLGKGWNKKNISGTLRSYKKIDLSKILVENSTYASSNNLKKRLIKEGLFEHKCYRCNKTEWEGAKIPIQLEHINGKHTDCRIENLTILCPNCHALTNTYCGRNVKIVNKRAAERIEKNRISRLEKDKKRKSQDGLLEQYRKEKTEKNEKRRKFFYGLEKLSETKIKEALEMFNLKSRSSIRYLYNKYRA